MIIYKFKLLTDKTQSNILKDATANIFFQNPTGTGVMHGHFAKNHIEKLPSDYKKFDQLFPKSNHEEKHIETSSNQNPKSVDKWDNKTTTSNLSLELTKFNHKIDSGANYPSLVTPQIKAANSDEFNSRQIINLEDLSYQEEKLVKLIDSLLLNQNIINACEEWIEIINITSIQNIEV